MERVRRVAGCEKTTIVVIPESNLGFEASHIADHLREHFGEPAPGNYVIMEEDDNRSGVRTNEPLKAAMTTSMDLMLQRRCIRFHQNFFSVGEPAVMEASEEASALASANKSTRAGQFMGSMVGTARDTIPNVSDFEIERRRREQQLNNQSPIKEQEEADKARDVLVRHLRVWTRTIKPRKDQTDTRGPIVIYTGKLGSETDDDTMALLIGNTYRKRFRTNEKYRPFWSRSMMNMQRRVVV